MIKLIDNIDIVTLTLTLGQQHQHHTALPPSPHQVINTYILATNQNQTHLHQHTLKGH